jgi:pimeloyl-ACP methyl ester carboxylesterase
MRIRLTRRCMFALVAALVTAAPIALGSDPWKATAMPAAVEQGFVAVAGASLYYATFGAGEPVILLHGGAGNSEHWANQIPALAGRFKVIVLDSRGHGRSTRDARPFSYSLMADDIVALMDALGLKRPSLVGWSDGGIVGLDLAIRHPERVGRLVLFGANFNLSGIRKGGGPHATFAAYFDRCADDYRRLSPTPASWDAFVGALRAMWSTQPDLKREQLARIAAPTLVLAGEREEIIRVEHTRELSTLIPGARLLTIRDASHFAPWQQPAAFNAALLAFLGG